MLEKESGNRDLNNRYLKNSRYCLAAKIDSGLLYDPYFDRNVEDFALTFGMKIINMSGSSEVAEKSYLAARKAVLRKT